MHFFLEDNHVDHHIVAVDLLDDREKEKAREELGRLNPRKSYPTVVIDGQDAVVGYEEEEIKTILGL
jgi:glutaredoxin-like protein NrdH